MSNKHNEIEAVDGDGEEMDLTETEEHRAFAVEAADANKSAARAVWVEAWIRAKGVESVGERTRSVAKTQFELWWERNIE